MARAIWSGSVSFGLVNVPVKAFTAVRDHEVRFHQLQRRTGSRIRNKRVSEKSGKEVDSKDIELGYELSRGRYVTVDPGELEELRPRSTRTIEIADFVALDEIDPIYYERTYWLAPADEAASRPYQLLLAAMDDRQRVGIGTVVMRRKQYLAAVRPLDGALGMSTMRFADEVVDKSSIDQIPGRRSKPDKKQLDLAGDIIDALATGWNPERYHDTYTEELRDIIKRRSEGKEVVVEEPVEPMADVVDLMSALEASVEAAKKGRPRKRSTAKKKAASRRRKSA